MRRLSFWVCLMSLCFSVAPLVAQPVFESCLSNGAPISSTLPPVVEVINVGVDEPVADTQVPLTITHTFQGDLEITLVSPFGVSVMLHDNGGGGANDFLLTYTDQGVPNGSQPYTCGCAMQPSGPGVMGDFNVGSSQGDWTLTVDDTLGGDQGTLDTWCLLIFDVGPPAPIQDLSCGSVPGTGVADAAWTNPIAYDAVNITIDGVLVDTLPGTAESYSSQPLPVPQLIDLGVEGVVAGAPAVQITCQVNLVDEGASVGPDVIYSDCTSISNFGVIGGIRAYALGSHTCNIGTENLQWGGITPLLAMNAYRLHEGRLEQIGMSWLKNGTGAAAGSGCGIPCNGQGGSVLGAGCRDIYGSGFNGTQGILGPRSQVNAFTGDYPGASGPSGTLLDKRLQIQESDLVQGEALYFLEGVYVAFDDAAAGNALNNASYKRMTVNAGNFNLSPVGSMEVVAPAIHAWRDNGLGVGVADPSVQVMPADIPGEGRLHVASKVTDLGGGTWRYDYAIFNLNSHRSGGTFSVPVPSAATVTGPGFHDVDYHTGEPYDNTDWNVTIGATSITWSSPETFDENENSNALRFGTMYNFWFDCDAPPVPVDATIGLFRPGTPDSITVSVPGPEELQVEFLRGDANGDGVFNGLVEAIFILTYQFSQGDEPPCLESADADGNAIFNGLVDASYVLAHQFTMGPPPPAPHPTCGIDPDLESTLGCDSHPGCP